MKVNAKVMIDRVELLESDFMTCKSEIYKVDGLDFMSLALNVLKPVEKVMIQFAFNTKVGDDFVAIYQSPLIDPCVPLIDDPMVKEHMMELKNHGNMTDFCPLKPGIYLMNNVSFEKIEDPANKMVKGIYRMDMLGSTEVDGKRVPFMSKNIYIRYE